jgi:hypothetical protein
MAHPYVILQNVMTDSCVLQQEDKLHVNYQQTVMTDRCVLKPDYNSYVSILLADSDTHQSNFDLHLFNLQLLVLISAV